MPGAQWGVAELAEQFCVSQKSIRRDLDELIQVGFPIVHKRGPHGRKLWSCETEPFLSGLTLTFEEATSLYIARRLLEPMAGTFFFDALHTLIRKIRSGLPRQTLEYVDRLDATFNQTSLGTSNYAERGAIIDNLMTAIEDRQPATALYRSAQSTMPSEVQLHPYGLVYHHASLYLVAHVPTYDEIRHYKIDRFHDCELTSDEKFHKPDEFTLQEHLQSSFGIYQQNGNLYSIRVRFDESVARYVQEHHWHPSQSLTEQSNGSLLLELELTALEEFKAWVLSFGAKAIAEEPKELRTMIAQDVEAMRRAYQCVK